MKYVPYHLLGTADNIIVDGAAHKNTVLTLSHWPGSDTPAPLKHDLSAGIVFNYLDQSQYHVDVEAVSNNHFDEDGLVGLWSILNPEEATENRDLLLDVAGAGDFGTYTDRDAARISFVINAWTKPESSPLKESIFDQPYMDVTRVLYEELLCRFQNVLDKHEQMVQFWKKQDDLLSRSENQLAGGEITIEEYPACDLAVVKLPVPSSSKQREAALAQPWDELVHQMAIHNATKMLKVLMMQGSRYRLYYRYETWVQYVSRKTTPRIDMNALADQLTQMEGTGNVWRCDDIDDIIPALSFEGEKESKIAPHNLVEKVVSYLVAAAVI